jgi:hypothetical protein
MANIIDDLFRGVGAVADTLTLDFTDFDGGGGNLPLRGVGEGTGINPRDAVKPDKVYKLGSVPSTILPGQIVQIRMPNGNIRKYRLERVKNRPQRQRNPKAQLDAFQNRLLNTLLSKK